MLVIARTLQLLLPLSLPPLRLPPLRLLLACRLCRVPLPPCSPLSVPWRARRWRGAVVAVVVVVVVVRVVSA